MIASPRPFLPQPNHLTACIFNIKLFVFFTCYLSVTVIIAMQQNTGQVVQIAPAGSCTSYERRRPEETVLYQLVQEHVETFFAQVEAETGAKKVSTCSCTNW